MSTPNAIFYAAQISFGQPFTDAEKCAENAELIGPIDGIRAGALGLKVRTRIPGYRTSKASNEEIAARFVRDNPCMKQNISADKCSEVQRLINTTADGKTLGAKLKRIFPEETADMRDRFAEKFVRAFCPTITLAKKP